MNNQIAEMCAGVIYFGKLYGKTFSLLLSIAVGGLLPQAHVLSFLVQYLLIIMLFLAFIDMTFNRRSFHTSIIWVLLANLAIPSLAYILLRDVDRTLALVAFMSGITPTAIAAPVIMRFLAGRVEYVAILVLCSNILVALVIPFALPLVAEAQVEISTWEVLRSVLFVVFVPLILARLFSYLPQQAQISIRKGKALSFPLWILVLFIVSSKAAFSLLYEVSVSQATLFKIAVVSLVVCAANFGIGALLGGKEYRREASQSLGQKNNSFTIWLALTFINPLIALGPTFYVVYHNLYNSFQIYTFEKSHMKQKHPAAKNMNR
ncbi:MAG: hypothetical protein JXB07_06795 [Anaerolineae bacterium]|nr:hypothetical protein [Anaerolineae bacterium]